MMAAGPAHQEDEGLEGCGAHRRRRRRRWGPGQQEAGKDCLGKSAPPVVKLSEWQMPWHVATSSVTQQRDAGGEESFPSPLLH